MNYNSSTIKISKVSLLFDHAFAITEENEIYGWGSNEKSRLGFEPKIKGYS